MTKKHYELIALAFLKARELILQGESHPINVKDGDELVGWGYCVRIMARQLEANNPKFDRARFLAACGVEKTE